MPYNITKEEFIVAEDPTLGAVEVAGLRMLEYMKTLAIPLIAMVFLNLYFAQTRPEVTNVFDGNPGILAANAALLAVPTIYLIIRKRVSLQTGIAAAGLLGLFGGFTVSVFRFALTLKFHLFFNILFETGALVLLGVVVGLTTSILTKKGVQWYAQLNKHSHAKSKHKESTG